MSSHRLSVFLFSPMPPPPPPEWLERTVHSPLVWAAAALVLAVLVYQLAVRVISPAAIKERATLAAAHAAFAEDPDALPPDLVPYAPRTRWARLPRLYKLTLHRNAPRAFADLRRLWGIDEARYQAEVRGAWGSFGAVGLSGSMFFHSADRRLLLKSLGRQFENHFLHAHFLPAYFEHVRAHPDTLLNKLVDVLYSFDRRIGEYLRASPSHYIVIENIAAEKGDGWELFDLKPPDYLEPFRDLVPERVQLSGVTDILPKDKTVLLPTAERADLLVRLRADLAFLAALGCVDYSVLLVCPPGGARPRLALIDVFWSLREPRALLTKAASDAVRLPQQTVTADADGYAEAVFAMVEGCVRSEEAHAAQQAVREDVVLVDL